MKRILLISVVTMLASACFDWDSDIRCRTDRHCPDDMICVEEVCEPGDRSTRVDGGTTTTSDAGP